MASLSGVALSAPTAKNENSLANLNIDFTLAKLEAPTEFRGLGNSLSLWRRTVAETGAAHRTARKLGALFEETATIPDSLYAAYGLRVSEISASEAINPQDRHRYGLFEGHVGADATTIWAAATAGKSAMAINLLACMLARLWSASQATSIWFELVEHRKKQISAECDGSEATHLTRCVVASQEITRKELAEWDSSARAWVSLADGVKKTEYQDLEAILQSLSLPVDTSTDVYTSVIRAWNIAMTTMDSLIRGMPHSVNGAVLVAISAWHIYPDVDVFGNHNKSFTFDDQLVQRGGCLTVGLEDRSPENTSGVYWSLSLAHLKYYGPPLALTARSADESKVTFDEFGLVVFGSLLRSWAGDFFNPNFEIREAAQLVEMIWEMLEKAAPVSVACREFMLLRENWMRILVSAANTLSEADDKSRHRAKRLALMGIRRGVGVLPAGQEIPPFFGLLDPSTLTSMLQNSETVTIDFFRNLAKRRNLKGEGTLIRYKNRDTGLFEFATAVARDGKSTKRSKDAKYSSSSGHIRWIPAMEKSIPVCDCAQDFDYEIETFDRNPNGEPISHEGTGTPQKTKMERLGGIEAMQHNTTCPVSVDSKRSSRHFGRRRSIASNGEACMEYNPMHIRWDDQLISWFNPPAEIYGDGPVANTCNSTGGYAPAVDRQEVPEPSQSIWEHSGPQVDLDWEGTLPELDRRTDHPTQSFRRLVGNIEEAALLVYQDACNSDDATTEITHLSLPEVQSVTVTGALDADKFLDHLLQLLTRRGPNEEGREVEPSNFLRAFKILGSASQIYKLLPGAQVGLRLLEGDLSKLGWARHLNSLDEPTVPGVFSPFKFNRSQALACVATFETACLGIEEMELQSVFAISVGNYIYAPSALFSDPYDLCEEFELMRIVGNVGKPGLTMMKPPSNPQIMKAEYEWWQVVNHEPFDATCQDYFGETSLHLSFSGYEQSVASTVEHGAHDVEAQYLETVVSVYDGKRWVADLDILTALGNSRVKRLRLPDACNHNKSANTTPEWISVDCWDELIDMIQEVNIVRAHGNPLARLAAVTVAIQIGNTTCLVLPARAECYECVTSAFNREVEGADEMGQQLSRKGEDVTILVC